ncbi:unnamed protein product [Callosobruchus maculatus]|uniref:YqaJ viral recombinase domain-containing protein n=1 Tax=Callosobruchus maculatus TaxID=64391 RepID=A0A653CGS1_CALMS|nr:unnamed protein product [Callosobruchus maculatus]
MDAVSCENVSEETRDQSSSGAWFEVRYARITASKLYEAAHCTTVDGCLVETILGATKLKPTKAMRRGLSLEDEVLDVVCKKKKIKARKVGIFLNNKYPIFAASPDALSADFCIEIKCPSKDSTFKQYLKNNEITKKPMAQMQLQMLLVGREKGLFCVASPDFEQSRDVSIVEVESNIAFCENLLQKATSFWQKAIFSKLLK